MVVRRSAAEACGGGGGGEHNSTGLIKKSPRDAGDLNPRFDLAGAALLHFSGGSRKDYTEVFNLGHLHWQLGMKQIAIADRENKPKARAFLCFLFRLQSSDFRLQSLIGRQA
ncbi:hypothetical protein GUJ93_ZPchr0004g40387 [Zizania palustris]|uniref:Uncharacterized protein n=1 Tax=Zizania palustris TaxID=103762 RepID=A0A8J5RWJ8_ZIZPA|nr:hypothetical protein GUJ93_ZPchr0004g40387 [Zizania palustris]